MKNTALKIISGIVLLSMMFSTASCGRNPKSKRTAKKVSEETPWFNANVIEVDTGADKEKNPTLPNAELAGMDERYYVIFTSGLYDTDDDVEFNMKLYQSNEYCFAVVVDRANSKTVNTIDLKSDFSESEYAVSDVWYSDGKITVRTDLKERDYDPLSGKLLDTRAVQRKADSVVSAMFKVGDYEVETVNYQTIDMRFFADLHIKDPDGNITTVEMKKVDRNLRVAGVLAIGDTRALVLCYKDDKDKYYELDLATNELILADSKEYEWLKGVSLYSSMAGSDGVVYFWTKEGVSRINAEKKEIEEVFNFSWCGLNEGIIARFDLLECSEDRFVICGLYDLSSIYTGKRTDVFNIIELTRADKNPHAGKTILELYSPNDLDVITAEAILKFNETNKKYFIKFTDRYDKSDCFEFEDDVNNDDVEELSVIKGNAEMGNKLAVDIMNGEGPDILMNVSQFGQLNNSNYLVDLSPFVKDRDMYFSNIIDGSRIDGALYQVPVSFSLEGIIVRKKDIGSSGKGFTLDEYREFISKGANGKDPILFGQATYFAMLFNSMSDKFIANGKVDLSAPEFAQLADYVKDNVREKGTTYNVEFDGLDPMAEYVKHCRGFGEFFQLMRTATSGQNGETLAGIPSCDGRGPRFSTECSVAVSAQALDINACGEFVKILLSEDIQTEIAKNDLFVINRNAFKKAAAAGVEYYNGGGQWYGGGKGISPIGLHIKLKEKDIGTAESVLLGCSRLRSEDSPVSIILIEEMPAYFLGQKDLDAVVKIAQNRIQKVLDERD